MISQLLVLAILIFFETVFPPAITPFSYSMIGALLVQEISPIWMSVLVVGVSVMSSVATWYFFEQLIVWIHQYQEKRQHHDRISRLERWYHLIIKKRPGMNKFSTRLQNYIDRTEGGKFTLFVFTVITLASALPDIVTIRIVKKHMHIGVFIFAAALGKAIAYLPVIFLGKGIQYLIFHIFK